jgi:type I restriction enzyme, S subunit
MLSNHSKNYRRQQHEATNQTTADREQRRQAVGGGDMSSVNWKLHKINELGFVGRGKSRHRPRSAPQLYGGPYPFVQTADIMNSEFYITTYSQTYTEVGLAQSKLWEPHTLCITNAGANTGESAILGFRACFPDSVIAFIADDSKSDVRFVKYYLDTIIPDIRAITRGATQDNLSVDKLLSFDFLVPPLPTQRKIASILSAYDDLIENNTRRIAILEEMAQSIYREWFVNFRFPGFEDVKLVDSPLGMIPEGWECSQVSEVFETFGGGTPSKKVEEYWDDGDITWFAPSDLTKSGNMYSSSSGTCITESGLKKSSAKLFPAYSVMLTSRATIGVLSINTIPACTNQGFITCIPNERVSALQLFFWLREQTAKILNFATGATFKEITKGNFRKFSYLVPPPDVSEQFNELAAPIGRNIETLICKQDNLRTTRDLLLPKLISGKLDVEDLVIDVSEPLEELQETTV